jgi:hypothetical protein
MSNYLLLLHEKPVDFVNNTPEQLQAMFTEYMAWSQKIKADGVYVGGNKLKDEGGKSIVKNGDGMRVTDGPFIEAKEVIGGYYLITASDYGQAVNISEGCPHLKYGGRIEVREIEQIG